ncbi:MAG: hypothetical protein LLF94_03015 [Chlamydiales bacterium]|nr:hypothetical protein [Chlamydiales bacterium]
MSTIAPIIYLIGTQLPRVCSTLGKYFISQQFSSSALVLEVAQVCIFAFSSANDAVNFPKATVLGSVLNFTIGKRSPIVIAAQAILVVEASLAISKLAEDIKAEARKIVDYSTGRSPIAIDLLTQKDSHDIHTQQSLRVKILCNAPKPVASGIVKTERVVKAIKQIVLKVFQIAGCGFKIGGTVFLNPISKNFVVTSMFSNLVKIYDQLKTSPPEELIVKIKANTTKIDLFLKTCKLNMTAVELTQKLQATIKVVAAQDVFLDKAKGILQHSAHTALTMVTGLTIAPLGLPPESINVHTRTSHPSRKTPGPRYITEVK